MASLRLMETETEWSPRRGTRLLGNLGIDLAGELAVVHASIYTVQWAPS